MKSKTRHVDGGGGYPRVHGGLVQNKEIRETSEVQQRHTNPNL